MNRIDSHYTNILPDYVVGPMQAYATDPTTQYRSISQDWEGANYRTVAVHPLPVGHPMEEHVVKTMLYFNQEFFQYDLCGTFEVQIMRYRRGDGFGWHSDYGPSAVETMDRKLSMTLQLSEAWDYVGGELDLTDWHNQPHTLTKECGGFVVFDSRVPHRVRRLTDGERYSIVAWAHGPKLK